MRKNRLTLLISIVSFSFLLFAQEGTEKTKRVEKIEGVSEYAKYNDIGYDNYKDGDTIAISYWGGDCYLRISKSRSAEFGFGDSDALYAPIDAFDFEKVKEETLKEIKKYENEGLEMKMIDGVRVFPAGYVVTFITMGDSIVKSGAQIPSLPFVQDYFIELFKNKDEWPPELCEQMDYRTLCRCSFLSKENRKKK